MLIPFSQIDHVLKMNNIDCKGALHLGAHECEELPFYSQLGLSANDVTWIDAIPAKVEEAKARGIPNVYTAVITDKDDEDISFNVSNNGQSSSVLEFGTHATEHPWVVYVDQLKQKSLTLNTFIERNGIDASKLTFWNLDIQGAELMALRGATKYIQHARALYLEVNEKELYKGCGLISEIDAFLATYSFKRVLTKMTEHGWGDALYISTHVKDQILFFDIGCNIGAWSMQNATACDKIIAVEASPTTFSALIGNCTSEKIVPLNYAVCNNGGKDITFYQAENHVLSTLNKDWLTHESSRFNSTKYIAIACKTITLDRLIEMYGKPSLIKIDVEGGEYECVTSLTQKVDLLCFEWASEVNSITFNCIDYLATLGFREFYVQMEDMYTFRPSIFYSIDTAKAVLEGTVPKVDWGMLWAK